MSTIVSDEKRTKPAEDAVAAAVRHRFHVIREGAHVTYVGEPGQCTRLMLYVV